MSKEIGRRDFLKAAVAGAAGLAATGVLGGAAFADEKDAMPFEGKKKFAGIGSVREVTDDIYYVGVSDRRIQLFENVYPIPRGVAYNSYVILDEKTALVDTVDRSVTGQFFENLTAVLDGRELDYLIVNHMEPDHSSAISEVLVRYPNAKVVCTMAASLILNQFFACDISDRGIFVREGDTLNLGRHTLTFVQAPMVHWPEVMMTFDDVSGVLFSADAFGSFGALNGNLFADEVDFEKDWLPDARRYYCNIVGKYGPQVQAVLKKAAGLEIARICPLHGFIWRQNLGWFIEKYAQWAAYEAEEKGVLIAYGSIYGHTQNAVEILALKLAERGVKNIKMHDVSVTHASYIVADAFKFGTLVFAAATYNGGIFTPMDNLLRDLTAHNLQNRRMATLDNGTWAALAGKQMREEIAKWKNCTVIEPQISIKSALTDAQQSDLDALADAIVAQM